MQKIVYFILIMMELTSIQAFEVRVPNTEIVNSRLSKTNEQASRAEFTELLTKVKDMESALDQVNATITSISPITWEKSNTEEESLSGRIFKFLNVVQAGETVTKAELLSVSKKIKRLTKEAAHLKTKLSFLIFIKKVIPTSFPALSAKETSRKMSFIEGILHEEADLITREEFASLSMWVDKLAADLVQFKSTISKMIMFALAFFKTTTEPTTTVEATTISSSSTSESTTTTVSSTTTVSIDLLRYNEAYFTIVVLNCLKLIFLFYARLYFYRAVFRAIILLHISLSLYNNYRSFIP